MVHELYNYLRSFMLESEWNNWNTAKQCRAIFTTMCLVGNIDVDTSGCDNMLIYLYNETGMEDIMNYDDFEMFMVELIV